jgi:hypothetical protein
MITLEKSEFKIAPALLLPFFFNHRSCFQTRTDDTTRHVNPGTDGECSISPSDSGAMCKISINVLESSG